MADRRTFLRGLVSLPLIGGGVTLIGQPAEAVPLIQAAALPAFDDPRQRARYAWEAFTSAMDDLTIAADGWRIVGAGKVRRVVRPWGYQDGYAFVRLAEVHHDIELERDRGSRHESIIERHREIALDPVEEARLRERQSRGEVRL